MNRLLFVIPTLLLVAQDVASAQPGDSSARVAAVRLVVREHREFAVPHKYVLVRETSPRGGKEVSPGDTEPLSMLLGPPTRVESAANALSCGVTDSSCRPLGADPVVVVTAPTQEGTTTVVRVMTFSRLDESAAARDAGTITEVEVVRRGNAWLGVRVIRSITGVSAPRD